MPSSMEAIQLKFGEKEVGTEVRKFPKNTFIYPEYDHRGITLNNVIANRLVNKAGVPVKIKGYTGWESRNEIILYFDRRIWTLPPLTKFGVPPSKGKLVKQG